MGKRPSKSYRELDKPPYTRSDYIDRMQDVPEGMKKSVFGNPKKFDFPAKIRLIAEKDGQVSARAIVAVRITIHRELRILGEDKFRLDMKSYPHHQSRSKGLVGVAKAERISSGMGKGSFGSPEMRMARISKGSPFLEVSIEDNPISYGVCKNVVETAIKKLPLRWKIESIGISVETKNAHVNLPKRTKEKKASSGGQQPKELQRQL